MVTKTLLGIVLVLLLVSGLHAWTGSTVRKVSPDTIDRVLRAIVERAETIATLRTPFQALVFSRECQAALTTLLALVGGAHSEIDRITGIDTESLQNILVEQERQIRASLPSHTPTG